MLIFQLGHLHKSRSTNKSLRRLGMADCALQSRCCIVKVSEYVILRILRDCCCQNEMIQLPFHCPFCFCLFAYSLCYLTSGWADLTYKSCKKNLFRKEKNRLFFFFSQAGGLNLLTVPPGRSQYSPGGHLRIVSSHSSKLVDCPSFLTLAI